jgi:hypothetical protein
MPGMKAQVVVVQDVSGRFLKKVAVHATEWTVYVTSESEFQKMKKRLSRLFPIGFDRRSVFTYQGEPIAKNLKPWRRGDNGLLRTCD